MYFVCYICICIYFYIHVCICIYYGVLHSNYHLFDTISLGILLYVYLVAYLGVKGVYVGAPSNSSRTGGISLTVRQDKATVLTSSFFILASSSTSNFLNFLQLIVFSCLPYSTYSWMLCRILVCSYSSCIASFNYFSSLFTSGPS